MTRISRPDYDKPHRCPGWSGGGLARCRTEHCNDGKVHPRSGGEISRHPWAFGHCTECDTVTLPIVTEWLDPTYLAWKIEAAWKEHRARRW